RPRVRQRLLGRDADGLWRRRREGLWTVHALGRRHRPRAHPRRDRARGESRLLGPTGSVERVSFGRLWFARQTASFGPDGGGGGLADRRGSLHLERPGGRSALDEGAG